MRVLATFAGAFAAGIFLAQGVLPYDWLLFCALAAFLVACGRLAVRGPKGRRLLLIGLGLCLAFEYNWLYVRQVQRPMEALVGTDGERTMTLCDYASATAYGAKATVRIDGLPGKLVYYGDETLLDLRPGQTVTDTVHVQSAARIRDDGVTVFTSKGIFLLAYQRGEAVYGPGDEASPRWWPVRLGQAMRERIGQIASGDQAAFLTAILTGDKSGLSTQAGNDLSEAGLYHILAVSGMHCGFLLTLVTLLTGRHRRRLTAGVMVVLLAFYALLTGGSPSVVRACVMLSLLLAAPLFRRSSDGPTALATALLLILVKNPFAAASISLQLSFGAMAGILWVTPRLHRLLIGEKQRGKVYRFLASGFSATMGATVLTAPISAYYFGTLTLIAPVSNLLCLGAASLVFMLGLVAVLLSFLWLPLGMAAALVPRLLAGYILGAAHLLASLPGHALYFVNPYLKYWLAFAYLLFLLAWRGRAKTGRKYAVATVCATLTLAVTVHLGAARYNSPLEAVVLDVGQGQSVALSSGDAFALVDCGSANSWYDAGGTAADHLLTLGCRELDYLVLTHYDADHVNGVESLLSRMRVDTLLLPPAGEDDTVFQELTELAQSRGTTVRTVEEVQTLELGRGALRIFPPVGAGEDNERGLSVLGCGEEETILVTGDMSCATERALLAAYELPELDVLVAGHHGSKYSTSEELLEALSPERSVISVGSNSYGHPAEEALDRMARSGCEIYRTDLQGTVRLSLH